MFSVRETLGQACSWWLDEKRVLSSSVAFRAFLPFGFVERRQVAEQKCAVHVCARQLMQINVLTVSKVT